MPRLRRPLMVVSLHGRPEGPGTLSALRSRAMVRALAGGERAEDAFDHLRFIRLDPAFAAHKLAFARKPPHRAIAIAHRAGREAFLHPPAPAAMRLLRQVLEEQRVHRPLEADMQFADLALRQRHQRHACELEMLVERRHVRLVARHAVQRLGQYHVEAATLRILHQRLDAGAQEHAGARYRGILIDTDDLPAFPFRPLTADA